MFIGRYEAVVDPKGRVHLPAKIRDALDSFGGPLVLTISDSCLVAFPRGIWLERYEAAEKEPYTPEKGDLLRAITENAAEVELKNGRILIPSWLREYAGIEKEITIVGRIKKFEIWQVERHAGFTGKYNPETLSGLMRKLGF